MSVPLEFTFANAVIVYDADFFDMPEDIDETIDSFGVLPIGWDYGRGGPISNDVRTAARKWAKYLQNQGFDGIDASPGNDNEIIVASSNGDHYFELIVEAAGGTSLAYDYRRRQIYFRRDLTEDETKSLLAEIKRRICNASDYFIQISTMRRSVNLIDLHSPMEMSFFQLLTGTAYRLQETQSQITSENTIINLRVLPGNLLYSGSSIPLLNYHPGT